MSAAELPDPLDFTARALAARGALVEGRAGRVEALLPAELAKALALPEEVALAAAPADDGSVACGIGSALLEALTAAARAGVPWAAAAPELDAPKVSQATSLAARMVIRNGLADVLDAASIDAPYLRAVVGWSVEADDRYEGAFDVAVGPDGGEPEARVATLLAARATAVVAERDARLRDVVLRYTPKVEAAPVAMVGALLPAVRVRLRLRRRKAERELRVTLPAGAQALDLLACELCGGVTARPALCDDRLHVACERCVPQAQGRFTCAACARGR